MARGEEREEKKNEDESGDTEKKNFPSFGTNMMSIA